ncbi:MAG: hypothetical protein HKN74_12800 [Acidimicrobiia bacterium]|nr:hypothetical protein [Acidimicrobiia bacterium]NNF11152.1 hypothetical protein [Acidimicrobiia bacterium]NNL69344.1 hypothetical protein [Acidimicrobiia bacterium]
MNERGSITLWVLGLTVMVLFLGGVSLDLWRAFEVRQDLAAMADSAANAGASRVDTDAYRASGVLVLDERAARDAVDANLDTQQDAGKITTRLAPDIDGAVISVTLEGEVDFTLLNIFLLGRGPIGIQATGTAEAVPAP